MAARGGAAPKRAGCPLREVAPSSVAGGRLLFYLGVGHAASPKHRSRAERGAGRSPADRPTTLSVVPTTLSVAPTRPQKPVCAEHPLRTTEQRGKQHPA